MGNLLIAILVLWLNFPMVATKQEYIVKLTSNGENLTVVVVHNSFSGTPAWERVGVGRYQVTLAGAFTDEHKTTGLREFRFQEPQTGRGQGLDSYRLYWDDEAENPGDALVLETFDVTGNRSDGILAVTEIRIEYYP